VIQDETEMLANRFFELFSSSVCRLSLASEIADSQGDNQTDQRCANRDYYCIDKGLWHTVVGLLWGFVILFIIVMAERLRRR
jgi:hypothetical protein